MNTYEATARITANFKTVPPADVIEFLRRRGGYLIDLFDDDFELSEDSEWILDTEYNEDIEARDADEAEDEVLQDVRADLAAAFRHFGLGALEFDVDVSVDGEDDEDIFGDSGEDS